MEALVRQARADLAAFTADEPATATGGDPLRATELALAGARSALRYNSDAEAPLVVELRALLDAVTPLVAGVPDSASVA